MVRRRLFAALLVAVAFGCGGQSRRHGAAAEAAGAGFGDGGLGAGAGVAGRGGADPGSGGEGPLDVPTKDGFPIGDCVDVTLDEVTAAGCPLEVPEDEAPCSANGLLCRYPIVVDAPSSSTFQPVYRCMDETWRWAGGTCGVACMLPGTVTPLDASDCSSRPRGVCDGRRPIYGVAPPAQEQLYVQFRGLLESCSTRLPYDQAIEVEFSGECPTGIATSESFDPDLEACVTQALGAVRWDCAGTLPCAFWEVIRLD